ncbi:MAG: SurA N-terminal domain-containing protein, partial [Bdellovibrionales bacterium]
MQALRSGVSGGILKFFLLGLLLLAGGGLVFTDVGGFFRGGVGSNTVAKVADEDISTQRFDRTVRRTLPQLGITPQQAYQLGYTRELLNTEIRSRLLSKAAQDSGVLIDEKHVIDQLQTILAPAVQSGMSPQDALQTLLRNQNFTEAELTAAIRNEQTAALLVGALQGLSLAPSTATAKALYAFENETRDIRYIEFLDKDIKDIASPTPEQLAALYDKTRESYAIPETRTIDVITIKTDALKNAINISDEDLREAYDEAIESYETPETRTIAQA